jgi:hypothetical protein
MSGESELLYPLGICPAHPTTTRKGVVPRGVGAQGGGRVDGINQLADVAGIESLRQVMDLETPVGLLDWG